MGVNEDNLICSSVCTINLPGVAMSKKMTPPEQLSLTVRHLFQLHKLFRPLDRIGNCLTKSAIVRLTDCRCKFRDKK